MKSGQFEDIYEDHLPVFIKGAGPNKPGLMSCFLKSVFKNINMK